MKAAWTIWKKYMRKMGAEEMVGMLIQPILWVLIFSKGMAGMLGGDVVVRSEYLSFMLPGIMALDLHVHRQQARKRRLLRVGE